MEKETEVWENKQQLALENYATPVKRLRSKQTFSLLSSEPIAKILTTRACALCLQPEHHGHGPQGTAALQALSPDRISAPSPVHSVTPGHKEI